MKPRLNPQTDEQIIESLLQGGDTSLFAVLYDRYATKVYRKCLSFAHDPEVAEDMAQDVLLKAFTQLARFKGTSKFSTWLYAVTYNYCVEYYRKASRTKQIDLEEAPDIAADDDREEQELLKTRTDLLRRALAQLSPEDKALLLMKYQDDVPVRDLMDSLEISESAVKMRLARARARVKDLITGMEEP
ncbi:MAG: sigma-70 family RNA polymerase sigma factor [Bacteroidia bacterium]|nr:sigma-70 family RNA polymerase sigma factor [Bacteroidia bacterium]